MTASRTWFSTLPDTSTANFEQNVRSRIETNGASGQSVDSEVTTARGGESSLAAKINSLTSGSALNLWATLSSTTRTGASQFTVSNQDLTSILIINTPIRISNSNATEDTGHVTAVSLVSSDTVVTVDFTIDVLALTFQYSLLKTNQVPIYNYFAVIDSNITGAQFDLTSTDTGGHEWSFYSIGSSASLGPVGSLAFRDRTAGATRFIIDNNGFVGFGSDNPQANLHVQDTQPSGPSIRLQSLDTNGRNWSLFSHGNAASLAPAGSFLLRDSTAGITRLVITDSLAGVGTTNPIGDWHVENGNSTGPVIILKSQTRQWNTYSSGGSSSLGPANGYIIRDSTTGATRFTIDTAGVIAMPAVYGHDMNGDTTRNLEINSQGELGFNSSTITKKTEIRPIGYRSSVINDINIVVYQYKKKVKDENGNEYYIDEGTGIDKYGTIAEELEKLDPLLVFYNETEDGKKVEGIHETQLIYPLIHEFQKLRRDVNHLMGV